MLKVSNTHSGFTLPELLIGAAISGVVIAAAGFGLVSILNANERAESENLRRIELNRALDYIADDVRAANSISSASSYSISSPEPSCNQKTTATPVLKITIGAGASANNILYYLNNVNGCSRSTWVKPGVIKRVQDANSTTIDGSRGSELVDALTTPASLPGCATSLQGTGGFYACIENSRAVTLYLYGRDADGNPLLPPVSTRIFARSTAPPP